jgi:molecular chaperone DnaK
VFDVIFPRGLRLPSRGEAPLQIVRSYHPAHNIGYFRYLECAHLGMNSQPEGEISNWDEIRVAFDPGLAKATNLGDETVQRYAAAQDSWVEEFYTCDANGDVRVKIKNSGAKETHEYRLGRWSKSGSKTGRKNSSSSS